MLIKILLVSLSLILFQKPEQYKTYTATAYTLRGKTASGKYVKRGIIAANHRDFKLGTKVHLKGHFKYEGNFEVADRGVGKNKIDIWVPSQREAKQFGRRKVLVRML